MKTIVATTLVSGSVTEAAARITAQLTAQLEGRAPVLTMIFASTQQPLAKLMPLLSQPSMGLMLGASTAGEFTEKRDAKGSVAAVAVSGDFVAHAGMGRGLRANPGQAVAEAVQGLPQSVAGFPHRTVLMLLDPLAGNGEETVAIASRLLGERTRLAGGAAGDDLAMSSTFVGLNHQIHSDAVVLAALFSKRPLGVGAHHGHHPLSQPLKVTKAAANVVRELGGRPAWDVWKEEIEKHGGINADRLASSDVGAFLLRYEAGITVGSEMRVRAPLSLGPHGEINFACAIPEGTSVRITESTPPRQISSARAAARLARQQMGGGPCAGAIVFDCICRNLMLRREFSSAVAGISAELGGVRLAGFETYGEIALDAGDMSGFHNTTTVVLGFPE